MTFSTQFFIPSFNISLRNSPQHFANVAFAKGNQYFSPVCWQIITKAKWS